MQNKEEKVLGEGSRDQEWVWGCRTGRITLAHSLGCSMGKWGGGGMGYQDVVLQIRMHGESRDAAQANCPQVIVRDPLRAQGHQRRKHLPCLRQELTTPST